MLRSCAALRSYPRLHDDDISCNFLLHLVNVILIAAVI